MKKLSFKQLTFILLPLGITACNTLPTSGPNHSTVLDINQNRDASKFAEKVNVVELSDTLVQRMYLAQQTQKFSGFASVGETSGYAGAVNVGDVLDISIWEAPPAVLFGTTFSAEGQGSGHVTQLPSQMVNKNGAVTVPFVGNIRVAGKTPEAIQSQIVAALSRKANQPQVVVKVANNFSSDVTVIRQGSTVRMPLTANSERVLDAVAAVGGTMENIEDVTVQLTRGNQVKTLAFETLIADPTQNIVLRSGDVVSLLNTPYKFTGLGAVGNNQQIRFSSSGITLAEAIGKMGGLIDTRSDPRGVFVFRYTPFTQLDSQTQQEWAAKGYNNGTDIPTVYRVNLLEPQSMFLLQRFPIQDKDIVYVSNAPLAEFQKFLSMIFSITSPLTSTTNSIRNF
ncbi:polysaccharide biosynthesis/export family protein [Rodentibacter trehalosifermentans]|uniref:Sugar ABC transporter substrate-binding protein n=1 Tax=Rodentibacter trehalosifermentans TaxID=1908263 RepID=A0A1V3IS30_9PAST|nr:polysaccharide biosynthesis/export family protein [Rodentibacter trehalosifermentans]OOF45075.1 sugar ABC transporter substrate-binding protein [Rodentibacter trehalosifermentans]OOF52335.1 sugar ABC transporter substrate-binding protein [Rodentibacter trehalosifermentans]